MEQELIALTDTISYLTPVGPTDRPILMTVTGNKYTLMIDGGNSEAHARLFCTKLLEAGKKLPNMVVVTHWHWDHIFGLSALEIPSISSIDTRTDMEKMVHYKWDDQSLDSRVEEGIEIPFCADAIKEEFKQDRNIQISLPSITFKDEMIIDLGGITCILKQVGGDHAPDGIVVYIKEEKVLFLADAIAPNLYAPSRRYTSKATLELLDKIELFDADTYIISHWKPISRQEYEIESNLLRHLSTLVVDSNGDSIKMKNGLETKYGRPLTEDELIAIDYFVNGYK